MHLDRYDQITPMLGRRAWLARAAGGLAALPAPRVRPAGSWHRRAVIRAGRATRFQIACMTLPYSRFPLDRGLSGIKSAGYAYVAWGTTHRDGAAEVPVIAADAPPDRAAELARKCRDLGLEPLLMFSMVYPEAPNAPSIFRSRIRQASARG